MGRHPATVSRHQTVSPAPHRRADVGSRVEKAGGEDPAAPSGGRGPLGSRVASSHRQREAGPRAVRGPARPAARGLRTPGRSPRDPEASTASATSCRLPARPGASGASSKPWVLSSRCLGHLVAMEIKTVPDRQ